MPKAKKNAVSRVATHAKPKPRAVHEEHREHEHEREHEREHREHVREGGVGKHPHGRVAIGEATSLYARSLIDPWAFPNGVSAPAGPSVPSAAFSSRTKNGICSIGTGGIGAVCFNPYALLVNDFFDSMVSWNRTGGLATYAFPNAAAYWSSPDYSGTMNTTISVTNKEPTTTLSAYEAWPFGSPLSMEDMLYVRAEVRLVAAGIRWRYIGTEDNLGGRVVVVCDGRMRDITGLVPPGDALGPNMVPSIANLCSMPNAVSYAPSREWHSATILPSTSWAFDYATGNAPNGWVAQADGLAEYLGQGDDWSGAPKFVNVFSVEPTFYVGHSQTTDAMCMAVLFMGMTPGAENQFEFELIANGEAIRAQAPYSDGNAQNAAVPLQTRPRLADPVGVDAVVSVTQASGNAFSAGREAGAVQRTKSLLDGVARVVGETTRFVETAAPVARELIPFARAAAPVLKVAGRSIPPAIAMAEAAGPLLIEAAKDLVPLF